jgi:hypothetical protein
MHRRTILLALGLVAVGAPGGAWAEVDEAFLCRNQERERRVELQHGERPDRLPCEVVYWRDFTRPGDGRTIWEAQNDYGFCIERTRDVVQRLQEGGWSCRKVAAGEGEVATLPAVAPRGLEAMSGVQRSKLDQALARDLQRLAELSSVSAARFEVAGAELGDLDRDGDDDAAVLLNYLGERPGAAQFLMAYRFDGETFHPTAKTYLGGLGAETHVSAIEAIDEGAIELLLQVRQQGDQECCPSGRHRRAYVLEEGDLVELTPGS